MDLSNKSLAFLLVVAIVISLGGTIISMNKLSQFGTTGMVTGSDTGTANLTIATDVSISFDTDSIDFGSGNVLDQTGGTDLCNLDTNGTSNQTYSNCSGWSLTQSPFIINNTGNRDVGLYLSSSNSSTNFTGGTGAELKWDIESNEGTACDGNTIPGWTSVSTTNTLVCVGGGNFKYADDNDTIKLHMWVVIPEDATYVGTKRSTTITATADDTA